ncbi:unnamed protein product, partial [Porites lobata]
IINDEEFVLLYDINTAKSRDFPYWNYEASELDSMSDDGCQAEFRFYKNDVYDLMAVLGFPETFTCYNGLTVDGTQALCIFLKRFAYPCRYLDMIPSRADKGWAVKRTATNGDPLCLYGDPAYPHRPQLQSPFKGARLTQNEMD